MARGKRRKHSHDGNEAPGALPGRDYATLHLPALPALPNPDPDLPSRTPPAPRLSRPRVPMTPARDLPSDETQRSLTRAGAASGTHLPVAIDPYATRAIVIPGSGKPIWRGRRLAPTRPRPVFMQVAVSALILAIVISGLISVSPLNEGSASAQGAGAYEAIANSVIWHASPGYTWYTAASGDTVETIARRFHCQVGGIYEMNGLLAGQELEIGKAYKIPTDQYYGLYYRPASYVFAGGGYAQTTYTDYIWSSNAGTPPPGAYCGPTPNGSGDNMYSYDLSSFDLKAPNPGAYWVRGFTWYHFGVDLANPMGTPIHAAQSGEVIFANWDTGGGGWSVKINHCDHLSTAYGHMETLLVHVHQMVHAGDIIGLEGSTGWSTGPHLHFSVQWDNLAVDPMLFFHESEYDITTYTPG